MKAERRRVSPRKALDPVHIDSLTSLDHFSLLARTGRVADASASGLLLHVSRKDFVPKVLRENLSIDVLVGEHVKMSISEMALEIDGRITRTRMVGKGMFEVAIDYSDNAPQYWRECLLDLLPQKGELDQSEDDELSY